MIRFRSFSTTVCIYIYIYIYIVDGHNISSGVGHCMWWYFQQKCCWHGVSLCWIQVAIQLLASGYFNVSTHILHSILMILLACTFHICSLNIQQDPLRMICLFLNLFSSVICTSTTMVSYRIESRIAVNNPYSNTGHYFWLSHSFRGPFIETE